MKVAMFTLFLTCALFAPLAVMADGKEWTVQKGRVREEPTPNQASDASFDKRLPPVLPGEEVGDGDKKIKVWSTAGSVSANEPPAPHHPSTKHHLEGIDGVSVIVDQRPETSNSRSRREVTGVGDRAEKADTVSAPPEASLDE